MDFHKACPFLDSPPSKCNINMEESQERTENVCLLCNPSDDLINAVFSGSEQPDLLLSLCGRHASEVLKNIIEEIARDRPELLGKWLWSIGQRSNPVRAC